MPQGGAGEFGLMGDNLVEALEGSNYEVWMIWEDVLTRDIYPLEDQKKKKQMIRSGRKIIAF